MDCSDKLHIELTKCFLDSPAPKHVFASYRVTLGNKQKEFYTLTTKAEPKETRYYEFPSFAIVALNNARRGIDPFGKDQSRLLGGMDKERLLVFMQHFT